MPEELPDQLTAIPKPEALQALYDAWLDLFHTDPDENSLRVLLAQWGFETGWGKYMHNYNFGNAKHVNGDGRDWCHFRCNEKINGEWVWFDPPHPTCAFRAFRTAADGAKDYLAMVHKRFNLSWPAVLAGDPGQFAHLLKQQHYYTDDEEHYTKTMIGCLMDFKSK